jgi:hypothetical protein
MFLRNSNRKIKKWTYFTTPYSLLPTGWTLYNDDTEMTEGSAELKDDDSPNDTAESKSEEETGSTELLSKEIYAKQTLRQALLSVFFGIPSALMASYLKPVLDPVISFLLSQAEYTRLQATEAIVNEKMAFFVFLLLSFQWWWLKRRLAELDTDIQRIESELDP